jgi:hypothetical protein
MTTPNKDSDTVSKKDYDELVTAYHDLQVRYMRDVGNIRRNIMQANSLIEDDSWQEEDLPDNVIEALCQIKVAALRLSVSADDGIPKPILNK